MEATDCNICRYLGSLGQCDFEGDCQMITQKDVSRIQAKLESLPVPKCARCHGTQFVATQWNDGRVYCVDCGRVRKESDK